VARQGPRPGEGAGKGFPANARRTRRPASPRAKTGLEAAEHGSVSLEQQAGREGLPKIGVSGLSKVYVDPRTGAQVQGLTAVDVTIEGGEVVCIVGPSGCGKSTLLNCLAELISASEGQVLVEEGVAGLESEWGLLQVGFKPHSCGFVLNPIVDAALDLRARFPFLPEEVERVAIGANHYVAGMVSDPEPPTGLRGRVSAEHCAAVALLDGAAQPAQFTDERVNAPEIVAMRRRVVIHTEPDLKPEAAIVSVTLKDGRAITSRVDVAVGTPANPLTDEQLQAKYLALAGPVLSDGVARELAEVVRRLESLNDVARLATYY